MADLGACQPIQDSIDQLETDVQNIRDAINNHEIPVTSVPALLRRIQRDQRQIGVLQKQLTQCLLHPPSNLVIAGVELTQATQFFQFNGQGSGNAPDNNVSLVANKALILRVYVDRTAVPSVPIPPTVTGKVSYQGHADLRPIDGPIPGSPSSSINRGDPNQTLNFRVPAADCTGTVPFTVTVFDPAQPGVAASSSAPVTVTAMFNVVPLVKIHGVLIHYTGKDANGRPTDIPAPSGIDLVNTLKWVGKTYPISGFNYVAYEVVTFSGDLTVDGGGGCGVGWNQLFTMLQNMRSSSGTNAVFVGLLPAGVPTGSVGGCGGGGVAIGYIGDGTTFAQEIGHAFGRAHAPCGNPGGPDPNYPTYNSYPSGSIGEFGFDSETSQVWNPASTFDFMSYCGPVWVSPYTYIGLMGGIISSAAAGHPGRPEVRAVARDYLYLNFQMGRDGRVDLLPSYHLFGSAPAMEPGLPSDVSCELRCAAGKVLTSHHCQTNDPHADENDPVRYFHEVIPWSPKSQSIIFLRAGKEVHTVSIEEELPKVTDLVTKRSGHAEELSRVEWKGVQSPRPVYYLVRYTHDDGKTWRAVAADLTDSRHVVNLDLLPGGERCRFQVVASTGIRTTVAESEYFAVPKKPVKAYLLSPKPGETYRQGESVPMVGGGFSPDFGTTPFADVSWASNISGPLGTGHEVITHTLAVGRHTIQLSVPDGLGGESSVTALIQIKPAGAEG